CRKQHDQQQSHPEARNGDAHLRKYRSDSVSESASMRRRKSTERDRDGYGKHDHHQRQRKRNRQYLKNQAGNRHTLGKGLAEVYTEYANKPFSIAPQERLIEPKLVAEACERFRCGRRAQHDGGLIARQQIHHRKNQQRDNSKRNNQTDKATGQKRYHFTSG